jgi:hypothetical protein
MKFCPVVPEICRGQVHGPQKERKKERKRKRRIIIIIIIIIRNGAKTISLQTLFGTHNKNCWWQPCLLTDRDKMSNLYRGPFIDASYHVSFHLAMRLQKRRFLEIDQSETRIACGGHVC